MKNNKVIFIFSSPLQFLFCSLIAEKMDADKDIYGFYYTYQKDFRNVFTKIIDVFDSKVVRINDVEHFKVNSLNPGDYVFFGNRYNNLECSLFKLVKTNTKNYFLYEEGFNTYLGHHFNNSTLNDTNLKLGIKNFVKTCLGKTPSHVKLNDFQKVYTTFKLEHLKDQTKWVKIDFLSKNQPIVLENSTCLFLSQTLVEDGFIDEGTYLTFMNKVLKELSKNYDIIFFKTHPRNDVSLMQRILNGNPKIKTLPEPYDTLPAEFFTKDFMVHLYGFTSSTLMYAASLFKTESFQCLDSLIELKSTKELRSFQSSAGPLLKKHGVKPYSPFTK